MGKTLSSLSLLKIVGEKLLPSLCKDQVWSEISEPRAF